MLLRSLALTVAFLALPACKDSSPGAAGEYSWGPDATLQSLGFNRVGEPGVSSLPNGQALALWEFNESTLSANVYKPSEIHSSLYTPGSGWSAPALLEAGSTPRLAGNAAGTTVALWDGRFTLRAAVYMPATSWSAPEDLSGGGTTQGFPFIAVDAAGNAIALWTEGDLDYATIFASRLAAGGTWTTPEALATYTDGYAFARGLAMNPAGEAMAVWSHYDGSAYSVHAGRYTPAGGWQGTVDLATGNGMDGQPQVAIDAAGNAIAAWMQAETAGNSIQARRFSAGSGTWSAAVPVEADASRSNTDPILGTDAAGNVFAVWTYWGSSRREIHVNRFTAGSGWGSAATLDSGLDTSASAPRLAVAADGSALAVWHSSDGSTTRPYSSRYRPGREWSAPLAIAADYGMGSGTETALAIDGAGRGTLLLREMTSGGMLMYVLHALRFE